MAGYRGAFLIGDSKLIAKIREIRKHAGMMVPLPIQNSMVAALSDEKHVEEQRARYNSRRSNSCSSFARSGISELMILLQGLYIWCTRSEDAWKSVDWLASLGILATPGTFYGPLGASHIRVAMTATDYKSLMQLARILRPLNNGDRHFASWRVWVRV
jgi:aspartate/methionine/tyrosine aminotransferase